MRIRESCATLVLVLSVWGGGASASTALNGAAGDDGVAGGSEALVVPGLWTHSDSSDGLFAFVQAGRDSVTGGGFVICQAVWTGGPWSASPLNTFVFCSFGPLVSAPSPVQWGPQVAVAEAVGPVGSGPWELCLGAGAAQGIDPVIEDRIALIEDSCRTVG